MNIQVRPAETADVLSITQLFYDTINAVNKKDYSPAQVAAWSSRYVFTDKWQEKMREQFFYVATAAEDICGFSSLAPDGYLDFMFVHKDFQGRGVASLLLQQIESKAAGLQLPKIWASVSITARPFFRSRGFAISGWKTIMLDGIAFENAIMEKPIMAL